MSRVPELDPPPVAEGLHLTATGVITSQGWLTWLLRKAFPTLQVAIEARTLSALQPEIGRDYAAEIAEAVELRAREGARDWELEIAAAIERRKETGGRDWEPEIRQIAEALRGAGGAQWAAAVEELQAAAAFQPLHVDVDGEIHDVRALALAPEARRGYEQELQDLRLLVESVPVPRVGIAIGEPVFGGLSGSILFVDSNGNLAQDTHLTFDPTKDTLLVPAMRPLADSTTAFQYFKADGVTAVLNIDSTNKRVGIGTAAPQRTVHVLATGNIGPLLLLESNGSWGTIFNLANTSVGGREWTFNSNGSGTAVGAGNFSFGINGNYACFCAKSNADVGIGGSITSSALAGAYMVLIGGLMGIGTNSPTHIVSLGGNAARTFWMERHTTANTAGNSLTVQAGGATASATDKAGGTLILSGGIATGSGGSAVHIYAAAPGAAGNADRAPAEMARFTSAGLSIKTGADPSYPIDVTGDINATTGFRKNGTYLLPLLMGTMITTTGPIPAAGGATSYVPAVGSTVTVGTEAASQVPAACAMTLSRLTLRTSSAQPGTGDLVVTLRKNGAATALTLTIAAGAAAGTFSDTTHSVSVAADDLLALELANAAATQSAAVIGWTMAAA